LNIIPKKAIILTGVREKRGRRYDMNVKKTAVFLLMVVLVSGYAVGQSKRGTETKIDENINRLLKTLEKTGETPE
jgi:hypothetical protein